MINVTKQMTVAALMGMLVLGGCKRHETTTAAAPAASSAPAAAPAEAPAAVPAATPGAAPAPATAAAPVKPFDLQSVAVSTVKPPAFPYFDAPKGADDYSHEEKPFDRVYVIAGSELRPVEGHYAQRQFPLGPVNMSLLEAWRNYDNAFRALGAVRVDSASLRDPSFIARNGGDEQAILKRMRVPNLPRESDLANDVPAYAQYLLRTPDKNIWLSFATYDNANSVSITTLEEKQMQQTIKPLQAAEMATALGKEGHIALYLNFDTDSDIIRPDSRPVVDEVAKLLSTDPALKLQVEGHTDNVGDAAHNRELSRRRAESVVRAVVAQHVDAKRLAASGMGADKPLADNATEEGRARNRRVELVKA